MSRKVCRTRAAHNPGGHASDRSVRRHRVDHHAAGTDLGADAHLDVAEHLGPRPIITPSRILG